MHKDIRKEILKDLKRVVIKVGSSIITKREKKNNEWTNELNANSVSLLARTIRQVIDQNCEVVLVSSGAAEGIRPFWGPYAISKAGLEAMARVWAGETEKTNLRINILNPGGTATGMRASAFPGENSGTLPQPADIAPAFLALLDPACIDHGQRFNARDMLNL